MTFLKDHPTLGGALLSLLGAVLGVFIHNPALVASLLTVAGLFVGVHQVVTPVSTAAVAITDAATQAATKVAADLDETIASTTGTIIPAAQQVVDNAVNTVLGGVLSKLGVKTPA